MNKKFYTLFALGTLLFAACCDNASPISGSTNVPNMVNPDNVIVPRSMVLCSQRGKVCGFIAGLLGWRNVELYFAGKDSLGHV